MFSDGSPPKLCHCRQRRRKSSSTVVYATPVKAQSALCADWKELARVSGHRRILVLPSTTREACTSLRCWERRLHPSRVYIRARMGRSFKLKSKMPESEYPHLRGLFAKAGYDFPPYARSPRGRIIGAQRYGHFCKQKGRSSTNWALHACVLTYNPCTGICARISAQNNQNRAQTATGTKT